jgi:antitoxin (DNA-binding transcriptional repressor) of toxin-antitoxin stability system
MTEIALEQIQHDLAELIDRMPPGSELIVTRNDEPIARLARLPTEAKPIWDEIADLVADAPQEELDKLPFDGADRHDFYIGGAEDRH